MTITTWRSVGRGAAAAALCGGLALAFGAFPTAAAAPVTDCAGTICTVTYTYTGGLQSWSVPAGVTSANFDVLGASGGSVTGGTPAAGGLGGESKGTLAVSPGDLYFVYVGGQGLNQNTSGSSASSVGGFNGGGSGGGPVTGDSGASGGGASDVRSGGALSTRLLVAGGGGGAASTSGSTGACGAGGAATGGNGNGEVTDGQGATASAGGAAGAGSGASGTAGALGTGGNGAATLGAGGGGGYYGGGGGGYDSSGLGVYGPGGGGSSFAAPSLADVVLTAGVQSGNGEVVITYVDDDLSIGGVPADITTTATGASGAVVTFTAPIALDPDDATPPPVTCAPASGSTFPIGTTTVTCTATDANDAQGSVSTSFTVTVDAAAAAADTSDTLAGATAVHTGEPWAGSAPLAAGLVGLGAGLVGLGLNRRRRAVLARHATSTTRP